ncbi:winged helix-turn-helix domain-containing protein [Halanaeroarchaeum sulfurireducens]|nr:winged helix-turn-helix domain-containing protein [Halanaeroarchaeum sulfurireducens]
MSEAILEFLDAKGGVGLLVALYDDERTYSDILEDIDASSSTLSERLGDAEEAGLIDSKKGHRHGHRTDFYKTTELGYKIATRLAQEGVVKNYRSMMTLKEQVEDGTETVKEAIAEGDIDIRGYADPRKSGRERYEEIREAADPLEELPAGMLEKESDQDDNVEEREEDEDKQAQERTLDAWEVAEEQSSSADSEDNESG